MVSAPLKPSKPAEPAGWRRVFSKPAPGLLLALVLILVGWSVTRVQGNDDNGAEPTYAESTHAEPTYVDQAPPGQDLGGDPGGEPVAVPEGGPTEGGSGGGTGGASQPAWTWDGTRADQATLAAVPEGDPARIAVLGARCGERAILGPAREETAAGWWCRVRLRVTHTGAGGDISLLSDSVFGEDGLGERISWPGMEASGSRLFWPIPAGTTVEGDLVVDLATGVRPTVYHRAWDAADGQHHRFLRLPDDVPLAAAGPEHAVTVDDLTVSVRSFGCEPAPSAAGGDAAEGKRCRASLELSNSIWAQTLPLNTMLLAERDGTAHMAVETSSGADRSTPGDLVAPAGIGVDAEVVWDLPRQARPVLLLMSTEYLGPNFVVELPSTGMGK